MDGSRKYLTEKELEEIAREIEASQSDDIGFSHDSSDSGSESEDHDEIDDVEEDEIVCSPNETDSSDDEIPLSDLQRKVIYGKNGYKWYRKPFIQKNTLTLQKNIVLLLPGPKGAAARSAHTEYEAWKLFFTDDILSEILVHTNEEINRTKTKFFSEQRYIDVTNKTELEALFGLFRKNKPEIPPEFLKLKISTPNRFAFTQDVVLVSHTPRKNKVMLLSTMQTNDEVDQSSGKSEVNLFYNATKGGVDVFDQICHSKSTARRTNRWPLRVFYGMLDAGAVNAYVIYEANNVSARKSPRKKFLLQLANDLAKEYMKKRLEIPNLTYSLRQMILDVLGITEDENRQHISSIPDAKGSKRCAICPRSQDRKGRNNCLKCGRNLCAEHRHAICIFCIQSN
nr:unnamed protein product [Callosobruchus analis]